MAVRVGVIGKSGSISADIEQKAYQVGKEIALREGVLLSGGRDGIMAAVSKGANEYGGTTVGILPGRTRTEANSYIDVVLTTGLGCEIRSNVLVRSSDVIIMINGGNGTFNEVSSAYLLGKPVIIFEGTGGWADKVRDIAWKEKYLDERKNVELRYADSVIGVVDLAFKYALSAEEELEQDKAG